MIDSSAPSSQGEPEPAFEVRFARLSAIVERLDREDTPLAEMLDLYREGIALARQCREYLTRAEQQIEFLENPAFASPPAATDESDDGEFDF